MVLTTIQRLSNEVILLIFEYLDEKSLLNASLVCKDWSELISTSTATMKKFKLCLNRRNMPSKGDHLKWKHLNLEIRIAISTIISDAYFNESMENIINSFEFSCTKNLIFTTMEKPDLQQIIELLTRMPQLENLCILLLDCPKVFEETKLKHVELSKLKTLTFFYHGKNKILIKFIKAEELSELKLVELKGTYRYRDVIPNFVKSCSKLKKCILYGDM